jgi:hypothetical protein
MRRQPRHLSPRLARPEKSLRAAPTSAVHSMMLVSVVAPTIHGVTVVKLTEVDNPQSAWLDFEASLRTAGASVHPVVLQNTAGGGCAHF